MYYKVFVKNSEFEIVKFDNSISKYSEFIKHYSKNEYRQYIITTLKMIKIIEFTIKSEGLIKDISINEDLYDSKEIEYLNKAIEKINSKKVKDIKNFFFHNSEESIDIESVKVMYKNMYATIISNGVLIVDENNYDKTKLKNLMESSL
ncbi:hypothetical protein ACS65S_06005 [Staphylococcus saprophyticus]